MGPPVTMSVGRSTDAAPISSDGTVLSHPPSSTTPSTGLARMSSSTTMAARSRKNMAVGRSKVSPNEGTGSSSGTPPASHTPRLTCSAISRKCPLHGVRSDQVLQMTICGRPSNAWSGRPRRIQARWMNASRSSPAYQCCERIA